MLPDWPSLKKELDHCFELHLHKTKKGLLDAPLDEIRSIPLFEGNRNTSHGHNGFEYESHIQTHEEILRIEKSPAEVQLEDVLLAIDNTANAFANKQTKMVLSTISDICDKAGNVLEENDGETPLDKILACIERVQMDFNEDGSPKNYQLVCGPEAYETLIPLLEKANADPEFQKRYNEIMAKKKKEWNARKAARKLVG